MLTTVFATKLGMTQAWTKQGKRLPITRCKVYNAVVVGEQKNPNITQDPTSGTMLEIGFGTKKLKNMTKPLRSKLEKSGFSNGVLKIKGVKVTHEEGEQPLTVGTALKAQDILAVGDVVKVRGTSKGRGFAGAVKRHGFSGGPKTHGQSDRERAVGSIGAGTTPGRVFKGQRMPGHMGVETKTVAGLVVLYINPQTQEIWLSGPVPGHIESFVQISKTGETRVIELDSVQPAAPSETTETAQTDEAPAETPAVEEKGATE